jgi:hypothetical protein
LYFSEVNADVKYSVTNVFQLNYESRLKSWYDLRKSLENADLETKCLEIDKWWQFAPLVNYHLHPQEVSAWPGPWDLLTDNIYCNLARGLGMIYTLLLLGVTDIDFCLATDDNSEEVALVLVDNAKYVMNYWPGMVLNIKSKDFTLVSSLNVEEIKKKYNR